MGSHPLPSTPNVDAVTTNEDGYSKGPRWFAEWISFVRTEVQKAVLRQEPTSAVLELLKGHWNELKQE